MPDQSVRLPPSISWKGVYRILKPWGLTRKDRTDEPGAGFWVDKKARLICISHPEGPILDKIVSDLRSPTGVKLCCKK